MRTSRLKRVATIVFSLRSVKMEIQYGVQIIGLNRHRVASLLLLIRALPRSMLNLSPSRFRIRLLGSSLGRDVMSSCLSGKQVQV